MSLLNAYIAAIVLIWSYLLSFSLSQEYQQKIRHTHQNLESTNVIYFLKLFAEKCWLQIFLTLIPNGIL